MINPEFIEKVSNYSVNIDDLRKEFFSVADMLIASKRKDSPVTIQKMLVLFGHKEESVLKTLPYTREVVTHIAKTYNFNTVTYRCVLPDTCYSWHVDAGKMCMHIPITTNSGCRFVYEDKSFHMPADGSLYAVNTEKYHSFMNGGKFPRTHITFENF